MTSVPPISVVIPAYNHQRFVGEAIASVQAQTLADFELVVIDDGSRDGTADVADGFARNDPRIRVIRQDNGGSHAAINRGVAEARGGWIAILNSDDRFAPQRLARLRDEALSGARFVVTATRLIDEHGALIDDPKHWWWRGVGTFHAKAVALGPVQGLLFGNYTVSTSNFFFSRALWDAVGPMRPLRYVIDWEWALRAALHDPEHFRYLAHEPLLDYRLHGSNTILRGALRGACEVNRLHRELLARFGAPAPLVAAIYRNQRLLRQNWRAAGEATAERYVRDREADIAELRQALDAAHGFVRAREADVATLQQARARDAALVDEANRVVTGTQQAIADARRAADDAIRARDDALRVAAEHETARRALFAELKAIKSTLAWRALRRVGVFGSDS